MILDNQHGGLMAIYLSTVVVVKQVDGKYQLFSDIYTLVQFPTTENNDSLLAKKQERIEWFLKGAATTGDPRNKIVSLSHSIFVL